jgi:hypothetical protein
VIQLVKMDTLATRELVNVVGAMHVKEVALLVKRTLVNAVPKVHW